MCKHLNGTLSEFMEASHERILSNGILDKEGINEMGNITAYEFMCLDCGRYWRYITKPNQKWLLKIHNQLTSE
jgi:uncharacterized protein CbrC (UPF0167 family)